MLLLLLACGPSEGVEVGDCTDAADNDGDGLFDCSDDGCFGSPDCTTSEADADTDSDSDADTDSDTDADTDSDTDTDTDTDTDPGTDSDSDGFTDVDESGWGTDPEDPWSWPYESSYWPDLGDEAAAAGVTGEGLAMGDEVADHTFTDQYGRPVSLYDFYGHVVLFVVSAAWSAPDLQLTDGLSDLWDDNRESGFIIIQLLIQDGARGTVEVYDLESWADNQRLDFPVVLDPDGTLFDGLIDGGTFYRQVPSYLLLDRTMRIDSSYAGYGDSSHEVRLSELLVK
ncbi:MAG: peroxiredoxin [Myxococcota bacterium]|jgi:peroxiredoxin